MSLAPYADVIEDPLLHSLSEYADLTKRALEVVKPRRGCEIGSQAGVFSSMVADVIIGAGGEFHVVEPFPSELVLARSRDDAAFLLHAGRSVDVLDELPPCDIWFVDGEHNYHTVTSELEGIDRIGGERAALVVCHDVGWPFGRRDGYFAPELYDEGTVHLHDFWRGVTLNDPGLIDGGFRSHGGFAFANHEGGPRNGVRTAVDDFLATRSHLEYLEVAPVFGVGFIFPSSASWAPELRRLLRPYSEQPLLARLERNRLDLYLRLIAMQDEVARLSDELQQLTASSQPQPPDRSKASGGRGLRGSRRPAIKRIARLVATTRRAPALRHRPGRRRI